MKLLRHLTAAALAVAVIAGLCLLWAHVASGGTGINGQHVNTVVFRADYTNGFPLGHVRNLLRTCIIELLLAAAVITVSATWHRRRRSRRAAG